MPNHPKHKEVHLKLDHSKTRYWVAAEYDMYRASSDEEEERVTKLAYQQVDEELLPYYLEGWILDGPFNEVVTLERAMVAKEGGLFAHEHFAAIVGARVRLRRSDVRSSERT